MTAQGLKPLSWLECEFAVKWSAAHRLGANSITISNAPTRRSARR
jgi:hypothetical protein